MSLKEQVPEIYERYGLTETEIAVYLVFLKYTQCTVSEVAGVLKREDLTEIQTIADKLEKLLFIKKIPGIVDRYIPLEPYFELFSKESAQFRDAVLEIKDQVLADQSARFEKLEKIDETTVNHIETTVNTQTTEFLKESDTLDVKKKELLHQTLARFSESNKILMENIQKNVFERRDEFTNTRHVFSDEIKKKTESARDRFEKTGKELENTLQADIRTARDRFQTTTTTVEKTLTQTLQTGKDRYDSTTKALEKNLHTHIDSADQLLQKHVNIKDTEAKTVWDGHNKTFGSDNTTLNTALTDFSSKHMTDVKTWETQLHTMINDLNGVLKKIADSFKTDYDQGIQQQKATWNKIIDDLLKDFDTRVKKVEIECKRDLDAHVEIHKENVEGIKPALDEILEKYMLRMKNVIDDLKVTFSGLLKIHVDHVAATSSKMRDSLNDRIETRHSTLAGQVLQFKKNTTELMDNLKDTSDRYTDLSKSLAKRGSAWKALLFGSHKKFQQNYTEIQQRISNLSDSMQKNFEDSTAIFVQDTAETTNLLKSDIMDVTEKETDGLKTEADQLDKKQQLEITATLESLAGDLTKETDTTLQKNITHCQDTTVKLKDSLENTVHSHLEEFNFAINKHRQNALNHKDECNATVKTKVNDWATSMDKEHQQTNGKITTTSTTYSTSVAAHLKKTTEKNVAHTQLMDADTQKAKTALRKIFDELLQGVHTDLGGTKTQISQNVTQQLELIAAESKQMNDKQLTSLNQQIQLVQGEFDKLNAQQIAKINEQIELFKKEVGEINVKQQKEIDDHIRMFQETVGKLDTRQHEDIQAQVKFFTEDSKKLETDLHALLESHKSKYRENTTNLQQSLIQTIKENIQDTKDAIADFTLNFMNSIDEGTELAEKNEIKLAQIKDASNKVELIGTSSTWHVIGYEAVLEAIVASVDRTKSTIIIVTPTPDTRILEKLSQAAYLKKSARFLYTCRWDMVTFGPIIQKMKVLGNIQFRDLKGVNDFYAVSRDAEEIVLCPKTTSEKDLIAIISQQEGYAQLFGSFIYPIFQANSRPI